MTKNSIRVFWFAVSFLGLWLFLPLVRQALGLEFASQDIRFTYQKLFFLSVPLAILLTLFGFYKSHDTWISRLSKVIVTIAMALGVMVLMIITMLGNMCNWTNVETLYEHKNDPSTKIIVREFGCGATGSGEPTVEVFKIVYYSKYLVRATKIDMTEIDVDEWISATDS